MEVGCTQVTSHTWPLLKACGDIEFSLNFFLWRDSVFSSTTALHESLTLHAYVCLTHFFTHEGLPQISLNM